LPARITSIDCFCIEAIDDFTNFVCARELAGVIAKRRDVSFGGVECLSRELEPSSHRTIQLANILMREIAQLGKLCTRFIIRENESERKVEPACTEFAHDPYLTI
jgi:hypothetical protein